MMHTMSISFYINKVVRLSLCKVRFFTTEDHHKYNKHVCMGYGKPLDLTKFTDFRVVKLLFSQNTKVFIYIILSQREDFFYRIRKYYKQLILSSN